MRRVARFANRRDASLSFMAGITAGIVGRAGNGCVTPMARIHACTHLLYTSVIVSRRCTRVTHYMYHVTLRTDTRTYALHHADECIGRRDKIQSTRKTRPARLFTDFYRLLRPTGSGEYRSFLSTYDPPVQVTPLSRVRLRPFLVRGNSVANCIRDIFQVKDLINTTENVSDQISSLGFKNDRFS